MARDTCTCLGWNVLAVTFGRARSELVNWSQPLIHSKQQPRSTPWWGLPVQCCCLSARLYWHTGYWCHYSEFLPDPVACENANSKVSCAEDELLGGGFRNHYGLYRFWKFAHSFVNWNVDEACTSVPFHVIISQLTGISKASCHMTLKCDYLPHCSQTLPKMWKRVWCSEQHFLSHEAGPYGVKMSFI